MPAVLQRTTRSTSVFHQKGSNHALLRTDVAGRRLDRRCAESWRGLDDRGLGFVDSGLSRDASGASDSLVRGTHPSNGLTEG